MIPEVIMIFLLEYFFKATFAVEDFFVIFLDLLQYIQHMIGVFSIMINSEY